MFNRDSLWDDHEYYSSDEEDRDSYGRKLVECKRCGKAGLHWEELPEGYRLIHPSGKIHKCEAKKILLDLKMKL